MKKPRAELWSWTERKKSTRNPRQFHGIVANDELGRWPDGRYVFTSAVLGREGDEVETLNTIYVLKGDWNKPWTRRDMATMEVETLQPPVINPDQK